MPFASGIKSYLSGIKSYLIVLLTITSGYLLVLGGLAYVGMQINTDIRVLESQARDLYQHPFQVNRSAHKARLAAFGIQTEVLQALAIRDLSIKHADVPIRISEYSDTLDKNFSIIEANFLGDMTKVEEGKELIASWKKQRPHLINLLVKHRDAEAEKYIEDVSGITYEKLNLILVYITEFSSSKAAFFADEATRQSDAAIARFKWFLGGFVLFSLFAGGLTTLVVLGNLYQRDMKLVQKHERIEHLAHYDALTGLPNRALFFDRLRQTLLLAKRNKGGLALMYLDLDGFKQVNDQHGHHAGDLLLMAVADRLSKCVRESDTVARLGGDEFTIILNGTHNIKDAASVAQKINVIISAPFNLDEKETRIGISIGIACYTGDTSTLDDLVYRADKAMYEAKLAGKNTYRVG